MKSRSLPLFIAGFVLAVGLLGAMAWLNLRHAARAEEAARAVAHTHLVRHELAVLLSLVQEVETGKRGFVLTGLPAFLEPYDVAVARLETQLKRLRETTATVLPQPGILDAIEPLVRQKLKLCAQLVDMRRTDGLASTQAEVATGRGKAALDAVRAEIARMDAVELQQLAARRAETQRETDFARAMTLMGSGLSVVLLTAVFGLVLRENALRRRANLALRASEEHLAVALRGANEELEQRLRARTAELELERAKLTAAVASMPLGVVLSDAQGDGMVMNPAAERMLGLAARADRHTRIGEYATEWEVRDAAGRLLPFVEWPLPQAIAGAFCRDREIHLRNLKTGYEWNCSCTAVPVHDGGGAVSLIILTLADVTERKRVEAEIRQLNASLEQRVAERTAELQAASAELRRSATAVEAMQDAVFMFAPDTLRFFFVNNGAVRQVGYTEAELMELTPLDIKPAFTEAQFRQMLLPLLDGQKRFEHFTTTHRHKDGRDVPVEINLQIVGEGADRCFVALCRDVSERQQQDKVLRERTRMAEFQAQIGRAITEQQALRPLLQECAHTILGTFEAAFVRIWTLEEGGQMLELQASVGQYRHLDGPHGRIPVGRCMVGRVASERAPFLTNDVAGDPHVHDPGWARREGMVAFAGYPLVADGKLVGVVALYARQALGATVLDALASVANTLALGILARQSEAALRRTHETLRLTLTDLSRANAELGQASRLKDEFLANMSHELRTPLNAILGLSEALLENGAGTLSPSQLKSLTTISGSGTRLLALINDILDLSKIEAGKLRLTLDTINVAEFCESCLVFVRTPAMEKRIAVSFEADGGVGQISADPRRLKQILVSLLTNAVKYTPEGGRMGLMVGRPAGEAAVSFTIWDTGIGIASADQRRLFRAFTQIDSGLSRAQEGAGLGLALVAKLVEMHGGVVAVDSAPGKGSRFTVTLPLVAAPAPPAKAGTERAACRRALIFEDDPTSGAILTAYLADLGIASVLHTGSDEALAVVLRERPDVIMLDIVMPNESGWVVLARLKDHPAVEAIPVVVISVVDEPQKSLALGAAAHFTKPVTRAQLADFFQRHLTVRSLPAPPGVVMPLPSGPRILLAEDNEANVQTIGGYLEDKGYALSYAANGAVAVKLARELCPALILMDLQMPVMDGLTAIRKIRADTSLPLIPILALTALAVPGDRERCLAAGATDYLNKPVNLKEFLALVEKLLSAPNRDK